MHLSSEAKQMDLYFVQNKNDKSIHWIFFVYCYLDFSRVWKCFGVGAEIPFLMLRTRE